MRAPSLRRHRPGGQAVVTLSGRDDYLGSWPPDCETLAAPARGHGAATERKLDAILGPVGVA